MSAFLSALLDARLLDALGLGLLHSLWQGTLIALVAFLLLRTVASPLARYRVAIAALVAMLVWPSATVLLAASRAPASASAVAVAEAERSTNATTVRPSGSEAVDASQPAAATGAEREAAVAPRTARGAATDEALADPDARGAPFAEVRGQLVPILVLTWLVGVLVGTARLLLGLALVTRLCLSARSVDPALAASVHRIAARVGVRTRVLVRETTRLAAPAVVGVLRPTLLVPMGLATQLPPAQLEAVLAHELAHVLRRDYLVNLLQRLAETLLFHHPATWWLSSVVRIEREHLCDDGAVRATGGDPRPLARALATLGSRTRGAPETAMALGGPARRPGTLLGRVARLLGHNLDRPRPAGANLALHGALPALALLLVPLVAPAVAQAADPTPAVQPLEITDGTCSAEELAVLERDIGAARVVTLGEAAPGSATLTEAKACIARFLVDRMGFDVLAFEGPMGTMEALTKEADPRSLLEGAYPFDTEEVLAFVEWVRERIGDGGDVATTGFAAAAGPATLQDVLDFLAEVDPGYEPTARAAYDGLLRFYEDPGELETSRAERWLLDAREVLEHLEANRGAYLERAPRARVERTLHQAHLVPQVLELYVRGSGLHPEGFMATNLLSLLDQHPDAKFIVWTDNVDAREAGLAPPAAPPRLGQRLSHELGDDHYAIAFTFATGEVRVLERTDAAGTTPENATFSTAEPLQGSLEAFLAERGWGDTLVLLDEVQDRSLADFLAEPRAMRRLGAYAREDAYEMYDLPHAFDALIYLEHSLPSNPVAAP